MEIFSTAIIAFPKQKSHLGFSPSFGKDSNDEVATKQFTTVLDAWVDITFIPHNDPEIS